MKLFCRGKKIECDVVIYDELTEEKIKYYEDLPKHVDILCADSSNIVRIHKKCRIRNLKIYFFKGASNCICEFGQSSNNTSIDAEIKFFGGSNSHCCVGNFVQMNGTKIHLCNGSACIIGDETMISYNVYIRTSDGHAIIDRDTKEIINKQKNPCIIGNHCWVGLNSIITKNAQIPHDTIVAAGAVVTKIFKKSSTIIGGVPAKIIKENIEYSDKTIYEYELSISNHCGSRESNKPNGL